MSEFMEVPGVSDMSDGELRQVEVDGHELVVGKADGAFYVADNRCPHLGGRLSKGSLEGTVITCHLHHSKFDLADGRVVQWTDWKGAVLTIAELARHPRPLRTYEVKVEDGRVLIGHEKLPPVEQPEVY